MSSGYRTPERNREVDGSPNSYHIRPGGQAADLIPPPGMSTRELAQRLRGSGLRWTELIDEGDHVHVAWGGRGRR